MTKPLYGRKRNSTLWLDYDPGKVASKYGAEWEDEGGQHPGVVFGSSSYGKIQRGREFGAGNFEDDPQLLGTVVVIKRLVGDWSVLEDDDEGVPRFGETPPWPDFSVDGLSARRDILRKLDAVDVFALINRTAGGLYLTEEERGN